MRTDSEYPMVSADLSPRHMNIQSQVLEGDEREKPFIAPLSYLRFDFGEGGDGIVGAGVGVGGTGVRGGAAGGGGGGGYPLEGSDGEGVSGGMPLVSNVLDPKF